MPRTIGRKNALTMCSMLIAIRFSALRQERARVGNLGPGVIGSIGDRDDLAVVLLSLGGLTGLFGGLRCAHISAEPVGFLLYRCFKGGERFLGITAFEQHDTVEFARRSGHARRHRMLLGLVFGIGGGTHCIQRIVAFAFGIEQPGGRDLLLNIYLLRPIGVLGIAQLVAQLGELGDVSLGGFRIARAGCT